MSQPSLRVDHFALPAFDAAATHEFYTRVMGFALSEALTGDDWGGEPWLMMIFDVAFHEEDHGGQRSLYFTDPNGTMLEITAPDSASAMTANPQAIDMVRGWIDRS